MIILIRKPSRGVINRPKINSVLMCFLCIRLDTGEWNGRRAHMDTLPHSDWEGLVASRGNRVSLCGHLEWSGLEAEMVDNIIEE